VASPDLGMAGSYDYQLVALSVLIAVLASYAALDLAGRVTAAGATRMLWLGGGATAMGIGIRSTHYGGMLAFRLPVPVQHDWPTVLVSLLAAVFASTVALFVPSRKKMGWLRATIGSVFMGSAIFVARAQHFRGGNGGDCDCYLGPASGKKRAYRFDHRLGGARCTGERKLRSGIDGRANAGDGWLRGCRRDREKEKLTRMHIPIITTTANALKSGEER
jgi:Bacterial signalling protein N terminal repeat